MEEKDTGKTFGTRLESFFAGKGFYIVLLLCVAVIGVSAWSMLSGGGGTVETPADFPITVAGMDDAVPTVSTAAPVVVTEAPAMRTEPTAEPAAPETEAQGEPAAAVISIPEESVPAVEETGGRDYYIWPVNGETLSPYSIDMPVFNTTMQDWRTHDGIDIAAEIGEQVRAAANGRVVGVYDDERLGTTVVLRHSNGLESVYSNLAALPTVTEGEQVGVGQVIGAVGDTAMFEIGEAAHLHFTMTLDGQSVDPNEYLP